MASQSLYRKWRSQTFGELVGQEPVIRTLKNALNSGNLAHAYLFTGPRGTGKTSTARLLAKTINCSQSTMANPVMDANNAVRLLPAIPSMLSKLMPLLIVVLTVSASCARRS